MASFQRSNMQWFLWDNESGLSPELGWCFYKNTRQKGIQNRKIITNGLVLW